MAVGGAAVVVGADVLVLPLVLVAGVVPVVLVDGLLDVDVEAVDVAVGGWPGRGGWRLVVVATFFPVAAGATAVEVTAPPAPPPVTPPGTVEPPLLTTTGGLPAPAAPPGSGGTGVTDELVSDTAPAAVAWADVMVVCVVCVWSVVS